MQHPCYSIHTWHTLLTRIQNKPADWYRVPRKEVIRRGGANIFYHHASFPDALKATYPEFNWEDSQFVTADDTPRASWKSDADVLNALEAAEAKLDIRKVPNWATKVY